MRALLLAAAWLALPGVALACSCENPSLQAAVADAKYVYIGTVMRARLVQGEFAQIESTILAHRIAKGAIAPGERVVLTGRNSCSTPLAVGRTYAVFENEHGAVNAMCTGTGVIHRAQEEEFLRKVKEAANAD